MFEKNSANNVCESKYRLVQECARIVEPFMDDSRKVTFVYIEAIPPPFQYVFMLICFVYVLKIGNFPSCRVGQACQS